jgi:hypothetical protein
MALGTYGITRPADMSPEDVEIIMIYTPSRDYTSTPVIKKLNAAQILTPYFNNSSTGGGTDEILGGMYNLRLPSDEFNQLGIYSLMIRPVQIRTTLTDCGVLSSLPSVKGLVVDVNNVPATYRSRFNSQGLVGYRVEYLNSDGTKIPNFYRMVTSSFYVDTVITQPSAANVSNTRYRYIDSPAARNLIFMTVSPSSSPSNNPAAVPYIGQPGQNVILTNTFFNPFMIEIEMAEYDLNSIAIALYGNQVKAIEPGLYTIYDSQSRIYKQYNLFEVRSDFDDILYEVRQDRGNNIDTSQSFDNIVQ